MTSADRHIQTHYGAGRRTARRLDVRVLLVQVLALVFALAIPARSQNVAPWPAVSPEEMAFKEVPGVAGAPAAILYREVQTDDEKRFETHMYRIKILTEQGKKYADVEIPYLMKRTQIDDIRARTISPNGSIADFHGQIFDRLVAKARRVSYQARVFTIPDVHVGTIIEYAYTIRWKDNIPDVIKNPSNYIITGIDSFLTSRWVVHDELFTRRAHFALRPVRKGQIFYTWTGMPPNFKPARNPDGTVTLDVENFPAFIEEQFMPPENILKARVDLFYVVGWAPNVQDFWRYQAKRGAESLEQFIGKQKDFTRYVQRIVAPGDAPEAKLRKIYDYVQTIRAVNYEPSRTEKERQRENLGENKNAEDIIKHGYAYGNEINYLYVALARAAGFQADIAQLTSRRTDEFARQVLDTSQLNAMVVAVSIDARKLFLDPATRYCPFGLLPWEESDAGGIILSVAGDPFIHTTRSASDDAVVERKLDVKLDGEGALSGTLAFKFSGQEALSWRLSLRNKDDAARRKDIEDYVKEVLPAGSTVEVSGVVNQETVSEPLLIDTRIQVPQFTTRAGRRILFPAGILQTQNKNQFHSGTRVHGVYFQHPFRVVDDVHIELPADLSVESLPQPKHENISTLAFDSKCERQEPLDPAMGRRILRLQRKQEVSTYYFPAANYYVLREFFAWVHAADDQQVVLVPTQPVAAK